MRSSFTDDKLNFLPNMDATRQLEGYRSVLKRIYFCEACYERVKLYLSRTQAVRRETNQAAAADRSQCARPCHLHRSPGSLRPPSLELLEVSDDRGHALSPLCGRGHDFGCHGLSLPGDDKKAVR